MLRTLGSAGLLVLLASCTVVESAEAPADGKAAVYHVDAITGDDSSDGRSPEAAWRSLAKVNKASLQSGDRVLFRRGQSWRGQLVPHSGSPAGAIAYGAFGEGHKPQLLGSAAMDRPEDWLPAGDGVWATVPLQFERLGVLADLQECRWWLHKEGGAQCSLTSVPSQESSDRTHQLKCDHPGSTGSHLQWSASRFSVRDGEYYLLTYRARCSKPFKPAKITLMKEGTPWTEYAKPDLGIAEIGKDWSDHTVRFKATQTADDARLTMFLGGALPEGATFEFVPGKLTRARCSQAIPLSVDVGNIIFDRGAATGVKKWSEADLRAEGDYFYDAKTWQVRLRSRENPAKRWRNIELALNRHVIDQSGRRYVAYEDLDLRYGAAHGIGGGGTANITVRNCDISYIGGGHQHTRPDGKPVRFGNGIEFWSGARDCLVEGCRIWEIYDAALTNQGSGENVQENITYRNNVIWNSEYSFEYWNRTEASRTRNIRFEHNTCIDAGYGWGHGQRPDPNGRHLMFYDNSAATEGVVVRYNIFCNATESCLRLHGRDWTKALTLEGNCWHQSKGPIFLWGTESVDATQFAAFRKAHGLGERYLISEPKFVDPAGRDYRLSPESPARSLLDRGVLAGAIP